MEIFALSIIRYEFSRILGFIVSFSLYLNLNSQFEHWITRLLLMSFRSCASLTCQANPQKAVTNIEEMIVNVKRIIKTMMKMVERGLYFSVIMKV